MNAARVLVVDDNAMNVELVTFILERDGFVVAAASNPRDVLARVARFDPALVLMDIQLPDIDGLSLTRQLKADSALRHIPVVALTAYAMKGDEAKMHAAGCDGYIAKPIEVASFAATVRAYIGTAPAPASDPGTP